jgi:hypothetical protein
MAGIVEPIAPIYIHFDVSDETTIYADSLEIALLRFLQCIFKLKRDEKYIIDVERIKTFMIEKQECFEMIEFFKHYPQIELSKTFYEAEVGMKIRIDWCQLLNRRSYFKYEIENRYKLCESVTNIFTFFNVFMPKLELDQPTSFDKMLALCDKLSLISSPIYVEVDSYTNVIDEQYQYTTDMYFTINGINYKWEVNEYFEIKKNRFGKRKFGNTLYSFE